MGGFRKACLSVALGLCLAGASGAQAATEGLTLVDPPSGGKLVPEQLGPEHLNLDNSIEGGATANKAAQRLFTRSGCILPGRVITYNVFLDGRTTFTFKTTPDRFFDVVMKVTFPGFFTRTVDRFFAGGTETLKVKKTVNGRAFGTVRISGFRNSGGCFNLRISP